MSPEIDFSEKFTFRIKTNLRVEETLKKMVKPFWSLSI